MYRLVGWKIYYDDSHSGTFTFRHKCGWEIYLNHYDNALVQLEKVRDHVC